MIPATEAPRKMLHIVMNCKREEPSWRDAQMVKNGSKNCGSNLLHCQWLKRQNQRRDDGHNPVSTECVPTPGALGWQWDKAPTGVRRATLFITGYFAQSTILKEVALMPFASQVVFAKLPSIFAGVYKHRCFQVGLGTSVQKKSIHYLIWKAY